MSIGSYPFFREGRVGSNFVVRSEVEALAKISQMAGSINLMLIDWNMPNMDGLTLVRSLRELRDYKSVPILLLARSIGNEAPKINDALGEAVQNTAPLGALRTTIEHATIIIGGLQRGRARLGG